MQKPELVFNLWYFIDTSCGYVYSMAGRGYWLTGSDTEKLATLKKLAFCDYVMAKRHRVPERFQVSMRDQTLTNLAPVSAVSDLNANFFEELFLELEKELPPVLSFLNGEGITQKMEMPKDPLCTTTGLVEDENGKITPITTKEQAKQLSDMFRTKFF
jgi:hypothetical protein